MKTAYELAMERLASKEPDAAATIVQLGAR